MGRNWGRLNVERQTCGDWKNEKRAEERGE
jgi:hypothetical protein